MTKTEAAEIIANDVRVWARQHDVTIDRYLVMARISELGGTGTCYAGTRKNAAARLANWRTVLRAARRDAL